MRIRRRIINMDMLGRLLSGHVEELTEDEPGRIEEVRATAVWVCEACGRPVAKAEDIRGRCVRCGRQCCVTCEDRCAVCHGPLCGECRLGFADKGLCVCGDCLGSLQTRLVRHDRLLEDKLAFERMIAVSDALARLTQSNSQERGSLLHIIGQIARLGMAARLSQAAKRLAKENERGQRFLP